MADTAQKPPNSYVLLKKDWSDRILSRVGQTGMIMRQNWKSQLIAECLKARNEQ